VLAKLGLVGNGTCLLAFAPTECIGGDRKTNKVVSDWSKDYPEWDLGLESISKLRAPHGYI